MKQRRQRRMRTQPQNTIIMPIPSNSMIQRCRKNNDIRHQHHPIAAMQHLKTVDTNATARAIQRQTDEIKVVRH
jgi:hypothetical protein